MAETITIKLPDGSEKQVARGTTAMQVAESISPRLAAAALVARSNGDLIDLARPLERDAQLRILTEKDPEALPVFRHSSAHLLAAAVLELFPETKLGHGPATESGFFYDFLRPTPFTPQDLEKIEKKMQELVQQDLPYAREFLPHKQGLERFRAEGDFMKCHFIEQFTAPDEKISIYRTGKFLDFCRGPHIPSTGRIRAFKLLSVAGAYWLGDEKNPQLQRIYGTAFYSRQELDDFLARQEEARRRDHRRLGKELELFTLNELVGAGLPLWLPHGATVRRLLEEYILEKERRLGYQHVYTPHLAKVDLYKRSGHWAHFHQDMFPPMKLENDELVLRPMNCPHHILVYESKKRSYRDLPVRIAELGAMYRYERSGVLSGLSRVRSMTLNDAHIFCTPDQIEDEFAGVMRLVEQAYRDLGITQYRYRLSLRDKAAPEKFVANDEMWELGERVLRQAMNQLGLPYTEARGEAAFYGPKLDIQLADVMGHQETYSTIQVDFHLPSQFGLGYVGADGREHRPVMIHRGVISTMERMVSYLIELYAGAFPLWLAPVQVVVVPISEKHVQYANQLAEDLRAADLRVEVDARNEKMNAKIREHALQKVPYMLVVGDKEVASGRVNLRIRGKDKTEDLPAAEFLSRTLRQIKDKNTTL